MSITISKQFSDLIYPLTKEELTILEQSILKDGVRDPLVVWQNGRDYLIDGHHRWGIINKRGIKKYKITKLKFNNKYEAISWILDNQLGRRNATPEGISYLRGLRYKNEKLQHGGNRKSSDQKEHLRTSELIAKQYKTSPITIRRDEIYTDAIETIVKIYPTSKIQNDIKHKILTRQINLSKKDVIDLSGLSGKYIKQVLDGKKELWQIKLEIEQGRKKRKKKAIRVVLPKEIKLYNADCLKVLPKLKENSIDSALLDPPYGIGMMNKEWDNFTPSQIEKYNLSYEGGKKYQKWCSKWGKELLRVIKPGGHILCFCSPRMYHRLCCGLEDCGWQVRNTLMWVFGTGFPASMSISQQIDKMMGKKKKVVGKNPKINNGGNWDKDMVAPVSAEAEEWEGWHTHIKNSFEPILLARKPLSEKTVAENVLKWGTGALNIDASRIFKENDTKQIDDSRFPSSVILNEEAGEELNRQAGLNVASYFYCPKPSLVERNVGCDDLPPKKQNSTGNIRTYNDRCGRCGKKFIGPKSKICQCPVGEKITNKEVYTNPNNHPTVKPIRLCEYLVRLITPPNGTAIDCFLGSGSSGMACANNNFKFVGVEKEKDYYQIARRRIMAAYRNK
jgi:DNA modification methylase